MYQQFVADNQTMTDLFACAPFGRVNVVVDGQAEIATAFISTGNYYQALGVSARIGRTILPDDDKPTAPPVAVISSNYWHTRFGADPAVVGKTINVNNVAVTIVGVSAAGVHRHPAAGRAAPDIGCRWRSTRSSIPQRGHPPRLGQPTYWWLQVMGRLKPGATAAQVQGNLEGVFQQTARAGSMPTSRRLPDEERGANRTRTEVPRLRVDSGAPRRLRRQHDRVRAR